MRIHIAPILLILAISSANASITYTYEGNLLAYSGQSGNLLPIPYLGDRLTASLFLSDIVTPAFTGSLTTGDTNAGAIEGLTISTGEEMVSLTDSAKLSATFHLEHGEIVNWTIIGRIDNPVSAPDDDWLQIATLNESSAIVDYIVGFTYTLGGADYMRWSASAEPSQWTRVSVVPIPGTASVFAGVIGIIGARLRHSKLRSSTPRTNEEVSRLGRDRRNC